MDRQEFAAAFRSTRYRYRERTTAEPAAIAYANAIGDLLDAWPAGQWARAIARAARWRKIAAWDARARQQHAIAIRAAALWRKEEADHA